MKLIVGLLIQKQIKQEEEIREYTRTIASYIHLVDTLYIYNVSGYDLDAFLEPLMKYDNIVYAKCEDLGEATNYERILNQAVLDQANFGIILEPGYYYEEESFSTIKRYILEHDTSSLAILTPMPLYGCQVHERKPETTRFIMGGCKMIGAFINIDIYKQMNGLKKEYYQTMFDYEYCIRVRLKGYYILLFNNEVLRNINYRIIEKKIVFTTLSTYDKDPLEIYYEYRNRLFLWKEYKKLDPYYVKMDQKLARAERHEMKWRDKSYRDKLTMFEKAKEDYKKGILGPIQYGKREIRD